MPVNIRISVGDQWGHTSSAYRELVIERVTNNDESVVLGPGNPNFHPDIVSDYRVRWFAGRHHNDVLVKSQREDPRLEVTVQHRYGDDVVTLLQEVLEALHDRALLDGLKGV
jgi:hypothetical protein